MLNDVSVLKRWRCLMANSGESATQRHRRLIARQFALDNRCTCRVVSTAHTALTNLDNRRIYLLRRLAVRYRETSTDAAVTVGARRSCVVLFSWCIRNLLGYKRRRPGLSAAGDYGRIETAGVETSTRPVCVALYIDISRDVGAASRSVSMVVAVLDFQHTDNHDGMATYVCR